MNKKVFIYQILLGVFIFAFIAMWYIYQRAIWNIRSFKNMDSVVVTAYNPVEKQCNKQPLITANGQAVCAYTLAISKDLEKTYKLGDTVFVIIPFIVKDRMNSRFSKSADILLFDEKLAVAFGRRHAWITKIASNNGK